MSPVKSNSSFCPLVACLFADGCVDCDDLCATLRAKSLSSFAAALVRLFDSSEVDDCAASPEHAVPLRVETRARVRERAPGRVGVCGRGAHPWIDSGVTAGLFVFGIL